MALTFIMNTQRFGVRKAMEMNRCGESVIRFENGNAVRTFFKKAMNSVSNSKVIQQIAEAVSPTFSRRTLKSPSQLTNQERLEYLLLEIEKGKIDVVLKNDALKRDVNAGRRPETDTSEKGFLERTDLLKFAAKQADYLKKVFWKMYHADYYLLETVYHYDENSATAVPVVIDPSTAKEHSTGWTSWDDPFEISALGLFKGSVTFRVGEFLKLGRLALAASGFAAGSENITGQYLVTGKSILAREWYGSYAIRFNLKSRHWEIPWIKYKDSGHDQRILVELKRQDRLLMHNNTIYTHQAVLIPPSTTMEKFLQDYAQGTPLPEHDVHTPIKLGRLFKALA